MRRKRLDESALGNRAATTLIDDTAELAAQCLQIGDLAVHFRQMLARDRVHRLARSVALIGKAEKVPHMLDRETKVSRPADETETREVCCRIAAIVPGGALRRRHKTDPFVVADRHHFCVSCLR